MGHQNPSEVHGPIRASHYRSYTARLKVSLSATQPILWVSICCARSFPGSHPSSRGAVLTRARDRTGGERTGRDIPHCPGSSGRQQVPPRFPSLARLPALLSERGMLIPAHFELWGTPEALSRRERGKRGPRGRSPPSPWAPPLSPSIAPAGGRSACRAIPPEAGIERKERASAAGESGEKKRRCRGRTGPGPSSHTHPPGKMAPQCPGELWGARQGGRRQTRPVPLGRLGSAFNRRGKLLRRMLRRALPWQRERAPPGPGRPRPNPRDRTGAGEAAGKLLCL